jgi:hypothetical protein
MTLDRIHYHWGFDKNGIEKYKRNNKNRNRKKKLTIANNQRDSKLAPWARVSDN